MAEALDKPSLIETSSCPYSGSASSTSSSTSSSVHDSKKKRRPYYPDRLSLLTQSFQTVILLAILSGLASVAAEPLQEPPKHAGKALDLADWLDANDALFWDSLFKYICIPSVVITVVGFVLDLLFSSEANQGSPILIAPVVFQSAMYSVISVYAQANGMLSHEVLRTFNTTLIGEEIFKRPAIVNMTFFHIGVCDLGLGYVMMLDFYSRVSSRRMLYRVIVAVLAVAATRQGLPPLLFYWLLLRPTLFQSAKIQKSTHV